MGTVNAPAGVDVVVFRDEDAKKVVNRRGAGDDEQFALEGEAGKPLFIGIARKLDPKKDPKEQQLQGLEDSYELISGRHRQVTRPAIISLATPSAGARLPWRDT